MRHIISAVLFVVLCNFLGCRDSENIHSVADSMAISVKDTSRTFIFTNKKYGQYYGQTNEYFKNSFQGWTYREKHVFSDYELLVDGKKTDRTTAMTTVFPYLVKRVYKNGITEELLFADDIDCLIIEFKNLPAKTLSFSIEGITEKFKCNPDSRVSFISLPFLENNKKLFIVSDSDILSMKSNDSSSAKIRIENKGSLRIALSISGNADQAESALENFDKLKNEKRDRIDRMLSESSLVTDNKEFNKAMMWAKVSLDALITTQDIKGIFAGLPWFNNYWGRDSFIALPGATFVTGNYNDAKDILLAFSKYLDINPQSKYYGRIPNRITLNETIYNTADAAPWFVYQCYNYYNYSNDAKFLREIYPVIKNSFLNTLNSRTDENGFLLHDDAETWMDAVGKKGPFSPRGNRAVDIQALWFRQIYSTAEIAVIMKDKPLYEKAAAAAEKLRGNFPKYFISADKLTIYDRIDKNGRPDASLRPNLFFALNEPELFPSSLLRLKILGNVTDKIVAPYGVMSLAYTDPGFHKYHQCPEKYHKDEAYHNGTIWQWLSGPVIQTLCGFNLQDMAWTLTRELTDQILNRGTVGSLSELMDAMPHEGGSIPALSGAVSQAWSLSEYIRAFYQDYLGVKVDASRKSIYLLPSLPEELGQVEYVQKVGTDKLRIKYSFNKKEYRIDIVTSDIKDSLDVGVGVVNRAAANFQMKFSVRKGEKTTVIVPAFSNALKDLTLLRDGKRSRVSCQIYNEPPANAALYEKIRFANLRR